MKEKLKLLEMYSQLKPKFLTSVEFSLTLLLTLIGITYFALLQALEKPCCDAIAYLNYGTSLLDNSILIPPDENQPANLRTFVYPVFLAASIRVAKLFLVEPMIIITVFQTLIYILAITFVSSRIMPIRPKIQRNIWIALMLNVFIWPYMGVALTDSLSTSLFLLFLGLCIDVYKSSKDKDNPNHVKTFLLVLCFSTLLELRPASVWILPILIYLLFLQFKRKERQLSVGMLSIFFGTTPILYQIYINLYLFAKFSPFPVVDLGSLQITWGIKYLKYITWMGGGDPRGIYSSQNLIGEVSDKVSASWYFENPLLSVKLLFTKLVGAFDFDFLLPYPQNRPWYSTITGTVSLAILIFGFAIMLRFAFRSKSESEKNFIPRLLPLFFFFCWASVTLVSAVELRFTLPMVTFFIMLIAYEGVSIKVKFQYRAWAGIFLALVLILFLNLAMFVRNQSSF